MNNHESKIGYHYNSTRSSVHSTDEGLDIRTTPLSGNSVSVDAESIANLPPEVQKQIADAVSKVIEEKSDDASVSEEPAWKKVQSVSWKR